MNLDTTPIELVKKDYLDFSFNEKSIWNNKKLDSSQSKKLFQFLNSFENLSNTFYSIEDFKFMTKISFANLNNSVFYKYSIEQNGILILEKIESSWKSTALRDYLLLKPSLENDQTLITVSPKELTFFIKFSFFEYLTIIHNEETYFYLLKHEKNI